MSIGIPENVQAIRARIAEIKAGWSTPALGRDIIKSYGRGRPFSFAACLRRACAPASRSRLRASACAPTACALVRGRIRASASRGSRSRAGAGDSTV
jgi:hypothetical protein